jgi:hypothetical protein
VGATGRVLKKDKKIHVEFYSGNLTEGGYFADMGVGGG